VVVVSKKVQIYNIIGYNSSVFLQKYQQNQIISWLCLAALLNPFSDPGVIGKMLTLGRSRPVNAKKTAEFFPGDC
jgi:hypothetical protein